ncbi:hypothetical protein QL093DRAFT_2521951 [Fusarium oxysporum]|nr:hypothetical protein QL093DRAFT_2521951 [Fusarium oxysporum]
MKFSQSIKLLLFPTIAMARRGNHIQQSRDDSRIPDGIAVYECSDEKQRVLERDFYNFSDLFCHWMVTNDPKPSKLLERDYISYKEMHSFSVLFNTCYIMDEDPSQDQGLCKKYLSDMLSSCRGYSVNYTDPCVRYTYKISYI